MSRKFFKNSKDVKVDTLETIFVSKTCIVCTYLDQSAAVKTELLTATSSYTEREVTPVSYVSVWL